MTSSVSNFKRMALSCALSLVALTACSSLSYALGPQPATPCPCEAEGHCMPQGPWGYTQTQWRRWPGDQVATQAEIEAQQEEGNPTLPGSEPPRPEKEGLRGPEPQEKRRKKKTDNGEALPAADLDADLPAVLPEAEVPADGGFGLPADLGPAEPDEQPVQPLEGVDGGPDQPVDIAPEPEVQPGDDLFDPFGQIGPTLQPADQPSQSTTQAPQPRDSNDPPPLPTSLQKFSRTLPQKAPVFTRVKQREGFSSTAMALAR